MDHEKASQKAARTRKTLSNIMPHIASPKANTGRDGAKKGMKIAAATQTMKVIVYRQPNRVGRDQHLIGCGIVTSKALVKMCLAKE